MPRIPAASELYDHEPSTMAHHVVGCAMAVLDKAPLWTSPIGRIATYAAVQRCVSLMIEAGEVDEAVMLDRALNLVGQPREGGTLMELVARKHR